LKLGLENKEDRWKGIALAVIVVVGGGYAFYSNYSGDSGPSPSAPKPVAEVAPKSSQDTSGNTLTGSAPPPVTRRALSGRAGSEFRPKLRDARPENRIDTAKVDPTLKLELLARVQKVSLEGGVRDIFRYGVAAPPPAPVGPIPKVNPIKPGTPQIAGNQPPPNMGPPPTPPPPPIPFKYYGFSLVRGDARKRAFFLDGEDIIVTWEGDMIKNRYKVVRVGVNSVEVEDTQFKNKQSLPLVEDIIG
jgi:hypothetical protein